LTRPLDITGNKFNKLTAIEIDVDKAYPIHQATNDAETLKLQHYTNLRLIQKSENSSKGNRATAEGRQLCKTLLGREWIYE